MGCDISFINKATNIIKEKDENGIEILDKKVLIVGLENAGKTSILLQCKEN